MKLGEDEDPRAPWVNVEEVAAVGPMKEKDSLVVLKGSGERLVVKGKNPGEIVFEISDAWRPADGASDSEGPAVA